jgi:alginate O-acetyltransferase complex protein AlgI
MLFNSIEFAIFLILFYAGYWSVFNRSVKLRNFYILVASYYFYGSWNWQFLLLIFASSSIDYFWGIWISNTPSKSHKKLLLIGSVVINIGILGFFKYFDFFLSTINDTFSVFGLQANLKLLKIILPVGISFYTFQSMSYIIDIYRKKIQPTTDYVAYLSYVAFFPQLVAGPIERSSNLLPQFNRIMPFNETKTTQALQQMLWGFFKKMAIADTCGIYVDQIFSQYNTLSGSDLFYGSVLFAFQIYCDFSGYSDIAIGCAKLFGFELMQNFKMPYFARDIADFWRRWHISLSTWFRDYLYYPLGGSKNTKICTIRNVFIVFVISGFWHGAKWNYIVWGGLHALFYLPYLVLGTNRKHLSDNAAKLSPSLKSLGQMIFTFTLVCLAWIYFRADSITIANSYIMSMFSWSFFTIPTFLYNKAVFLILLLLLSEWFTRTKEFPLFNLQLPGVLRWMVYYVIIVMIFLLRQNDYRNFIYFQF